MGAVKPLKHKYEIEITPTAPFNFALSLLAVVEIGKWISNKIH